MIAIKLPPDVEQRLRALAAKAGQTEVAVVQAAIMRFLDDAEDAAVALERLHSGGPRVTLEDLERELGLDR